MNNPKLLTREELAEYLGTSVRSVARMVKMQRIPHLRLPVSTSRRPLLRFDLDIIRQWQRTFLIGA